MANFNPAPGHYKTRPNQLPAHSHAMFAAGHGYYAAPNPGIQPPPKPAPKRHSQSVSEVANQRVNQQLAPVLGAQDAQAQQQNKQIQAFAMALLGKLQGSAAQVGANYDTAIGQTAALSGVTANALRSANPNQQDQQFLQALNAPGEQQAQVQNGLANTFGGGAAALQFTQGEVPGSMLASQKASSQAEASKLPGIAALKGQQDLAAAQGQQRLDRQRILANRPGMVADETKNIQGNLSAKAQAAYETYKFETARADAYRSAGMKAEAAASQKRADLAYKYASLDSQNKRSQASIAAQNQRSAASIKAQNQRSAKSIAAQNKRAEAKKVAAQTKKSDYPNLTKSQVLHLRSGIANAFGGVPEHKDASGKVTQEALPKATYQEAIDHAIRAGYSRAAATRMANRFYMPGERGRPGGKPDPVRTKVG